MCYSLGETCAYLYLLPSNRHAAQWCKSEGHEGGRVQDAETLLIIDQRRRSSSLLSRNTESIFLELFAAAQGSPLPTAVWFTALRATGRLFAILTYRLRVLASLAGLPFAPSASINGGLTDNQAPTFPGRCSTDIIRGTGPDLRDTRHWAARVVSGLIRSMC